MRVVFVGAGGSGVSALVELMIDLHIPNIVCIDAVDSPALASFRKQWVTVIVGHGQHTYQQWDFVIYSAAVATSSEVTSALEHTFTDHLSPPPMLYAEFLGELSKYLFTIAISWTHGKSTTTGMVATACIQHIPTTTLAIVWAWVTERQGNHCWYNKKYDTELRTIVLRIISRKASALQVTPKKLLFVIEADEFNHHFLFLEPDISIITSLDHDHVDIYPTRDAYLQAFRQFCTNTRKHIVTLPSIAHQLWTYWDEVHTPPQKHFTFSHLVGWHNHSNASLALWACLLTQNTFHLDTNENTLQHSIEQFLWLQRRVELVWNNKHAIPVFSDYGHHPDEIQSTLQAFREKYPDTLITCFFEAHQARRLLTFWQQFLEAFTDTTCIVVPPYTAREDIASLQSWRKETITSSSTPEHIDSFSSLADIFSDQIGWSRVKERGDLSHALDNISSWAILCFSAGILDSKVRATISE